MIGTLNFPTGTSLRFSPENRFSLPTTAGINRKMSFTRRNPCKAALHAIADTTACAVENRRPESLYEVLRVKRNASPVEIKTAYRRLAKMYHPDSLHSQSNGRDFIEIHDAYATLSDPAARAVYDLSLSAVAGRRSFRYSMGGYQSGFQTTRSWETDQCW